ncbi:unnamed protein product [Cyclocybe aegerita]|uniref:C2H2-type domain-containing protein n=1 Tax=Cyclocybe aegerita TaxID=1973307 RepID=A0A8S0VXZ4_CYCAE|nr:unnamed protein product [Cyclocybe aegerita]
MQKPYTLRSTVLGKRKTRQNDNLVLHLTSPELSSTHLPDQSDSEPSGPRSSTSTRAPLLINGSLVAHTKKKYQCTFNGCEKAYTKPSRLEEHERSHTGQRPFVCETCSKSYLRETHLHAHARSHLPESMRPLVCEREGCEKRFWTSQHLHVHYSWHDGAKPYKCNEADCSEAFAKHHQLRAHICSTHAPPGTKPYRCEHEGCTKSFNTNQHLRSHQKMHDNNRYTCVHPSCLAGPDGTPTFFPTWSSLQSHIRKSHPPACPHSSCNDRTFANQANLRAHLRLHEQKELELELQGIADSDNENDKPPKKRRRGGEHGRDWKCEAPGCDKDFKSKRALQTHTNVSHLGKRNFVCHHADCKQAFGYKHLLQRHLANVHSFEHSGPDSSEESSEEESHKKEETHGHRPDFNIDMITGNTYAEQASENLKHARVLQCPFPDLKDFPVESPANASQEVRDTRKTKCDYVFSRGYDLRRHLNALHEVAVSKEVIDAWVRRHKCTP